MDRKKGAASKKSKSQSKSKSHNKRAAEEVEVEVEMADVDRIIDERGKGAKREYLCTWMDNGEPQWLAEKDLEGTSALEEWQELEDDVPEQFDPEDVVVAKCATLAKWLQESSRPSWLVGAGISASVLPTFRGSGGLWVRSGAAARADILAKAVHKASERASAAQSGSRKKKIKSEAVDDAAAAGAAGAAAAAGGAKADGASALPAPTFTHTALVELEQRGHVHCVASQNYDNLLLRAGFPKAKLAELHGNIFREVCDKCGHEYERDFEVELADSVDHETGRFCEQEIRGRVCGGALKDNIIHFGEQLPWRDITLANAKFSGANLTVVLGSSLRVECAASLPFKAKRRKHRDLHTGMLPRAVIVNLQPTPRDHEADLIIRARCDDVLRRVLALLPPRPAE
jgi:NAD-dependent SIR2 family protein deacetylase